MTTDDLLVSKPQCGEVLISELTPGVCELRGPRDSKSEQQRVNLMVKDWNWNLCDAFVVSVREDGTKSILDAGTRYAALMRMNYQGYVPCRFLYGLTPAQEALYFALRGRKGVTKALSFESLVNAKVKGDDPAAVEFWDDLREAGIYLGSNCHSAERLWKAKAMVPKGEWKAYLNLLVNAAEGCVIESEFIGALANFSKQCPFPITNPVIHAGLMQATQVRFSQVLSQFMSDCFLTAKGNGTLGGAMFRYANSELGIPVAPKSTKRKAGVIPTN